MLGKLKEIKAKPKEQEIYVFGRCYGWDEAMVRMGIFDNEISAVDRCSMKKKAGRTSGSTTERKLSPTLPLPILPPHGS